MVEPKFESRLLFTWVQLTPSIETELMKEFPSRWSLYHRLPPPRLLDHAFASPLPPRIVSSSK